MKMDKITVPSLSSEDMYEGIFTPLSAVDSINPSTYQPRNFHFRERFSEYFFKKSENQHFEQFQTLNFMRYDVHF